MREMDGRGVLGQGEIDGFYDFKIEAFYELWKEVT